MKKIKEELEIILEMLSKQSVVPDLGVVCKLVDLKQYVEEKIHAEDQRAIHATFRDEINPDNG